MSINDLIELSEMVRELNTTNSTNKKKEILAKYPQCQKILRYTFDTFKQYNVTSSNLNKLNYIQGEFTEYDDIFNLLDDLTERKITGHHAVISVNAFCAKHREFKELIYNIIDKDLKCRVGVSLINKVFPKLIPEFKVALAKEYEDFKHKVDFTKDPWMISRKLDGVRCIVIKKGNKVDFFSRTGKPFFTLDNLKDEVLKIKLDSFVLDSELCIVDKEGNENFKLISKEYNKKNHTIENPKLMVFDLLSIDEFESGVSNRTLYKRISELSFVVVNSDLDPDKVEVLDQTSVVNDRVFDEFVEMSIDNGWEGLMLRKDGPYEGKRTKNLLKVKQFIDEEFVVEDIETGLMRHIVEIGGATKEIESEMMTKAVIRYKGHLVGVGSGWSIQQRLDFFKDPSLIIGKTITVQHFGESTNDKGGLSLRFPTVKMIYENGRDV